MNTTSRAILQTVVTTDTSLSSVERGAVQRLIDGKTEGPTAVADANNDRLLVTQKVAARMLSVSRVTIWRMAKDGVLHPVEILPGTVRYAYRELAAIAQLNSQGVSASTDSTHEMSAA
jgi:predicted DNA-binding transcriptional regulator AlpA